MATPLGHSRDYMRLVASQLEPEINASLSNVTDNDAMILRHYEASQRSAIAKLRRAQFHTIKGDKV